MDLNLSKRQEEKLKSHRRWKRWQKIVSALACVVVFCTTYALILPAITMEQKTYCGYEEHEEHTVADGCYRETAVLICRSPEGETHVHSDACYEISEKLKCGKEESKGHTHGESCYKTNSVLVCGKEESKGHTHSDACYTTRQILSCKEEEGENHTHSSACYAEEKELTCGKEESKGHTHSGDCYKNEKELICSEAESEGHTHSTSCYEKEKTLKCGKEEGKVHTHTDSCYRIEKELICEKPIHIHTEACYSNPDADVEKQAVWERTMSRVKLTGHWDEDVIAIAQSQIGYQESTKNYIINEDGKKKGYSRYGAWYGDAYGDWCAMFVSFCLNYAQVDRHYMPIEANCQRWIDTLSDKELKWELYRRSGSYEPRMGDLIFFDWDKSGSHADHVGLVAEVKRGKDDEILGVRTIEGNSSDQVRYVDYAIDDERIMGYAQLPENPNPPEEDEIPADKRGDSSEEEETIVETDGNADSSEEEEAIVETDGNAELPLMEKTCQGRDYVVTVTYTAEAEIPEEAKLTVVEIQPDSEEYKAYYLQTCEALGIEPQNLFGEETEAADTEESGTSGEPVDEGTEETEEKDFFRPVITFARYFDISFVVDDEEIEPAAPVDVAITYDEPMEVPDSESAAVVHFAEDGTEVLEVEVTQSESAEVEAEAKKENTAETVDTFTFTQESFSVTGTVITANTIPYGDVVMYVEKNGKYYAMAKDGSAVEIQVNGNQVYCADGDRSIIWNHERDNNNQMYIYNDSDGSKGYLTMATNNARIGTTTTATGVSYTTITNGTTKLHTGNNYAYLWTNDSGQEVFISYAMNANYASTIHFATAVYDESQSEGTGAYYRIVDKIQSGKDYLIVSEEGNYALTLNGTTLSASPVYLNPVKGNPGVYQIETNPSTMHWRFPGAAANGSSSVSSYMTNGSYYLRLKNDNNAANLNVTNNTSAYYRTMSLNYSNVTNSWNINHTYNNTSSYLTLSTTRFASSNSGNYVRNMLILEQVDKPSVPSDPAASGESDGSGTNLNVEKPTYPAYTEPSGAITEDTELEGVTGTAYSDPATSKLESFFDGIPSDDGKVLQDKSVTYGRDDYGAFESYADNTFGVTMSALAQQYALSELEQVPTPIDVVFVLDVSGSMQNATASGETRRQALVNAVNSAMGQIFAQHPQNRAGVVVYSSGSWDLLQLDHYSPGNNNQYLTLVNNNVYSATNLRDSKGATVARRTDSNQQHGTYTQAGIAQGAAMFERVRDTTYTTVVGSGENERTVTIERQPIIILLSDGDPTHCTSNYMDVLSGPHYGSGSYPGTENNRGIQGYYTILSANYYKSMVGIHYGMQAKFYTVGMGINQTGYADLSNNSATGDHYKRAVLNPTADTIRALTNTRAKNYETTSHQLRDLLNGTVTDKYITVGSTSSYSDKIGITGVNVPVLPNPYTNYSYADGAYFGNITQAQLTQIFSTIIEESLSVKQYGFILVKRSSTELCDPIGEGMHLVSEPVLNYQGSRYTATSHSTSADGLVTTYVYDYQYSSSIREPLKAELSQIHVTVTKDPDTGQETVRMSIPDNVLPVYAPCEVGDVDWYYEALPVRLTYQVGLTDAAKEEIANMPLGETRSYYTNRYQENNPGAGASGSLKPQPDNPYYNGDNVQYRDHAKDKTDNNSGTSDHSVSSIRDTVEYQGDPTDEIVYYLGNNGKLEFAGNKATNVDITLEKTNMSGDLITGSPAIFELYKDAEPAEGEEEASTEENPLELIGTYTTEEGRATMEDLSFGVTYHLKEIQSPAGYNSLPEMETFQIEMVDGEPTITGIAPGNTYLSVTAGTQLTISVKNSDGYKLPETGGMGTTTYTIGGALMMSVSLLYGVRLRRKRERRTE